MGASIPPASIGQNTFADAAAVVHRLLTKGSGTEHARIRAVAGYLQQIAEHYFEEGKKACAPEVPADAERVMATPEETTQEGTGT